MGRWTLDTSPAYVAMDLLSRVMSPYDLNPFGFNPLLSVLTECVDLLARSPIKLSAKDAPPIGAHIGRSNKE